MLQGWGNLVNTAVLCALLAIFHQTGNKYNHHALDAVWRISFGLGLIPVTAMLIYRLFFLQESKVWKRQNKPMSVGPFPSRALGRAACSSIPVFVLAPDKDSRMPGRSWRCRVSPVHHMQALPLQSYHVCSFTPVDSASNVASRAVGRCQTD